MNFVTPDYFQTLGIRVEGATFGPSSAANSEVIINRGFARKFFHGRSAVGARFRFKANKQKPDDDWFRVVGVADDVPSRGLAGDRSRPVPV